jgi:pre-rRNA-processing protein TSR1
VQVKVATKRKKQELKREERRRKAKQFRTKKREDVVAKKRAIGSGDAAPFLTAVIPLGVSANLNSLIKQLKSCDADAKITTTGRDLLHIQ